MGRAFYLRCGCRFLCCRPDLCTITMKTSRRQHASVTLISSEYPHHLLTPDNYPFVNFLCSVFPAVMDVRRRVPLALQTCHSPSYVDLSELLRPDYRPPSHAFHHTVPFLFHTGAFHHYVPPTRQLRKFTPACDISNTLSERVRPIPAPNDSCYMPSLPTSSPFTASFHVGLDVYVTCPFQLHEHCPIRHIRVHTGFV